MELYVVQSVSRRHSFTMKVQLQNGIFRMVKRMQNGGELFVLLKVLLNYGTLHVHNLF